MGKYAGGEDLRPPTTGKELHPREECEKAGVVCFQDWRELLSAYLISNWGVVSCIDEGLTLYFACEGSLFGKLLTDRVLLWDTVGHGKQPQLLPSSPRWAVANGAAVILSVCDDEAARYETADLTASAVPALLIRPPPPAIQDDQTMVLNLPPLEPYARLFHR